MKWKMFGLLTSTLGFVAIGVHAEEPASPPAPSPLVKVEAFPTNVDLTTSRDRQSIVVQATQENGITRDVTGEATYNFANPALVRFENHVVYPAADGATELKVEYGGQTLTIPVTVKAASEDRPISFKLDVMPIFMKSGCNSGSCHGAARGKDGFRLSLFGFDPDGDHYRITHEINGRRINLAIPEQCLMVEKAIGTVPHSGGKRFEPGGEMHQTLIRWLAAGVPKDPAEIPTPISLEILPKQAVLDGKDTTQQMTVRAKYSDGTDRDVTSLALFLSNNDTSAKISENGKVTAAERGEAFVMARFATFTVGSQIIVVPKGLQFEFPKVPENNYVDTLVNNKLKKLRITPSDICTDEEFLRRVFLDIAGTLPTRADYDRFMASQEPDKRAKLVDELLGRKEFAEVWVMKFAELLQIRTTQTVSYKAINSYYNWLQDRIANNVPMNQIVQELLGASGGTFKNPATNYYQLETDTLKVAENVAQVFMGMRIQCAQCHNHPFDRWTMDDYYSFAAFFAQIGRKGAEDPREVIVFNSGGGEVNHLVGGRPMPPKFLGGETPNVAGKDRRVVLAEWLASPENPFFARNLSNIIWAHFLGKGIIDPVDDVRISNPASNPELLDALAAKFTEYKYDFKSLVRDICNSRTYQLSTQRNDSNKLDEKNFSHGPIRRIRAEVMLDAISAVTETKNKFQGLPLGARAVQIADGVVSNYFLTTFGRATRETVCSCEVVMEPNLSQALHLLNGDTTSQRIPQGNIVKRMLDEKKTPMEVLEELYIRCFSRKPSEAERAKFEKLFAENPNHQAVLEDTFWALLNSKEFMFNH
ncbi:MAG: DUF1549 domain-containing protein [Planctomycetota bacterium]